MTPASFQLTSNCLPIAFQLPVFQLAVPIELARWKVRRTFHLALPLYRLGRPLLVPSSRGGAAHRRSSKLALGPLANMGPVS